MIVYLYIVRYINTCRVSPIFDEFQGYGYDRAGQTDLLSEYNSNSNWTLKALNLPYSKGTLRHNKTKKVNQFQYPGTERRSSTMENARSE